MERISLEIKKNKSTHSRAIHIWNKAVIRGRCLCCVDVRATTRTRGLADQCCASRAALSIRPRDLRVIGTLFTVQTDR